jgi:hypothetical protein
MFVLGQELRYVLSATVAGAYDTEPESGEGDKGRALATRPFINKVGQIRSDEHQHEVNREMEQ